jgi:hypothetical protein
MDSRNQNDVGQGFSSISLQRRADIAEKLDESALALRN